MKQTVYFCVILFLHIGLIAQQSGDTNNQKIFRYPNGNIASIGVMQNGKPNGYWKSYYTNGNIKSEGNRKNFMLDSTWVFYTDSGKISLIINYKNDKKNGITKYYNDSGIVILEEPYIDNVLEGILRKYHSNGQIKAEIPYTKGKKNGRAFTYSKDGRIVLYTDYKNGVIFKEQRINRLDKKNRRQGIWIEFYNNKIIKSEERYYNGLKHGFCKYYRIDASLVKTEKYKMGQLQEMPKEITELNTAIEYYEDGNVKFKGTYRDNIPEGVHRYYDTQGKVDSSHIFEDGVLIGQGIYDDYGLKQGYWKEFYNTGELKAEGRYRQNLKQGLWKYYFKNGQIEQMGQYLKGKPDGDWTWYYPTGEVLREEVFYLGLEDGESKEYNPDGSIIYQGNYSEGEKIGKWFYQMGNYREEGEYIDGMRNGKWLAYYKNTDNLFFEGKFTNGMPDGKHVFYHPNGTIKQKGKYEFGKKNGDWTKYTEIGEVIITITFKDDVEIKYNGEKIKPSFLEMTEDNDEDK